MSAELHSALLLYTIHDDGARTSFLEKVKENFPECRKIDESTYSIENKDLDAIKKFVHEIYLECNSSTSEIDYISILYAAHRQNYSYKAKKDLDCIVEFHIVGNNS